MLDRPTPDVPLRVLHALAVSLPHQNGYTVRSHYVVATQAARGIADPVVVTSPYYPGNPASREPMETGGVRYLRVPHPSDLGWRQRPLDLLCRLSYKLRKSSLALAAHRRLVDLRETASAAPAGEPSPRAVDRGASRSVLRLLVKGLARRVLRAGPARRVVDSFERRLEALEDVLLQRRFARGIEREARLHRVDLVHAHSPYRTALPAIRAARALRLPVVYEVRGLWEESAVAGGRFVRGDARYRRWREQETRAMRAADAILVLGDTLREEVIARGIERERVFVVPNAVDAERFRPSSEAERASEGPLEGTERLRGTVLGYIGSVRTMEGVDELVRGAAEALRSGHDVSLLIVGDGPELAEVRELASELGLADRSAFPGRVPHDRIGRYYDRIDLFVVSRPDTFVTRTVTPLKPLEAMAMGKTVIVSDLPALRELVANGRTGLTYRPGDPADLARQAARLISDPGLARELAEAGRRWILEDRTWERSLAVLPQAYRVARERAAAAPAP